MLRVSIIRCPRFYNKKGDRTCMTVCYSSFRHLWNIRLLQCVLICSVLALLASCVVLCLNFCLNMTCICYEILPCQFPCEYYSFWGLCCEYCQNGKLKKLQGEKSKYREIFGGKWQWCGHQQVYAVESFSRCAPRREKWGGCSRWENHTHIWAAPYLFGAICQAGERPRGFVRIKQKAIPCGNNQDIYA